MAIEIQKSTIGEKWNSPEFYYKIISDTTMHHIINHHHLKEQKYKYIIMKEPEHKLYIGANAIKKITSTSDNIYFQNMFFPTTNRKYMISGSSGYFNGINYVCATCIGNGCSDCRYMPPANIRQVFYIAKTQFEIAHRKFGDIISNKIK